VNEAVMNNRAKTDKSFSLHGEDKMNHSTGFGTSVQSIISKTTIFMLLLFSLVASTGTTALAQPIQINNIPVDKPFACDPSLYMTQGPTLGSGPYERTMVELDPSSLSTTPNPIGNSTTYVFNASTHVPKKSPISINGIAHSFKDGAIYAISEHNSDDYQQGQHIYRIFRDATGTAINLYDLGKPVISKGAPNLLTGKYTGGTMVPWYYLKPGLVGTPAGIPHNPSDKMESLMVVSSMYQGSDSPSWTWHNHLFILAVEKSHIGNGPPRIIAGPIYVQDQQGNELSGLYDIAYNPADKMIYGHNSDNPGKIVQIDLSNSTSMSGDRWKVKATFLNLPSSSPSISNVGAAFFNDPNELLLFGIHSGSGQNQLFSASSLISGTVVLSTLGASTTVSYGASDGTSCAYSPTFTKTVSPNPATPGSTVTYTYTITNNQYSAFTVNFNDIFDSNLTVTGVSTWALTGIDPLLLIGTNPLHAQ